MAVGGAGILSGMNPKGYIDEEAAEQIVNAQIENSKHHVPAPGSVPIHYDETGFFREVYEDDLGVIEGIKSTSTTFRASTWSSSVLTARRLRSFRLRICTASSR